MSKPFEKATDDLRQIKHVIFPHSSDPFECVKTIQRRYIVQDGPITSALSEPPPFDESLWMHAPGIPMHWMPVKSEWRELPQIFENEHLKLKK